MCNGVQQPARVSFTMNRPFLCASICVNDVCKSGSKRRMTGRGNGQDEQGKERKGEANGLEKFLNTEGKKLKG